MAPTRGLSAPATAGPHSGSFHPAPHFPGWDPAVGRPSPNLPKDTATTVQLGGGACTTSYPPWAWLAFDPIDNAFWAASPASCVSVITTNGTASWGIQASYAVGQDPFGVAVDTLSGDVYVTNTGSNNVTVLDSSTGLEVANISVGASPYGVAYDPAHDRIYVANGGSNNVSVISGSTYQVVGSVGVGVNPIGVAVDPATGQVFVANNGSSNVTVLSTATNAVVANVAVGTNPYGVAVDNATDQVYVSDRGDDSVSVVGALNATVVTTIGTGDGMSPEGLAYDPVHRLVWVGAVFYTVLINTSSQSVLGYEATDPSGVAADPTSGWVCATNTANATLRCMYFPGVIFPINFIEFQETGLPSAANWSVQLYWPGYYASTEWNNQTTIGFLVFSGDLSNYSYVVPPADGYYPTLPAANLSVAGLGHWVSPVIVVNVTFVPMSQTFAVTFVETGLPSGTGWNVTLAGVTNRTTSALSVFREPPGTYVFSVPPVDVVGYRFQPVPSNGSVTVGTTNVTVSLDFSAVPPPPTTFSVIFVESGLPNGTTWEVWAAGQFLASYSQAISFYLQPGNYTFHAYPVRGFSGPTPTDGAFSVIDQPQFITLAFAPLYQLSFIEGGLPSGTPWSVTVGQDTVTSSSSSLWFALPPGTYVYAVGVSSGFRATPSNGTVAIGGNTTLPIQFVVNLPPIREYTVAVTELGLPGGTAWCVRLNATDLCGDSSTIGAALPNASGYYLQVLPVAGYSPDRSFIIFAVVGAPVTLPITFTGAPPALAQTPTSPDSLLILGGVSAAAALAVGIGVGYLVGRRTRPREPLA